MVLFLDDLCQRIFIVNCIITFMSFFLLHSQVFLKVQSFNSVKSESSFCKAQSNSMSAFESWFSLIVYFIGCIIGIYVFRAESVRYKLKKKLSQETEMEGSSNLRKIAYLNAILTTLYLAVLVWTSLPHICQFYSTKVAVWISLNFNTCITWFQLERLKVCFGKNQPHQRHIPYSYPTLIFWFIRVWLFSNSTLAFYVAFFNTTSINTLPFGCGIDRFLSHLESQICVISVIATDWIVLSLYIFKIMQLSLGISKKDNSENSLVINRRLKFILSKLLILSLLMEMTFLMGCIGLTINDSVTTMIVFNRIAFCLDGIISMKGLFLMLEANSDELENYFQICKCRCLLGVEPKIKNGDVNKNRTSVINTTDVSIKLEHVKYEDPSEITCTTT